MSEQRCEAMLEAYPGSSIAYGDAVFDRRCRFCARFLKMPETIMVAEDTWDGKGALEGDDAVCDRCGPVKLVFEGYF